MADSKEDVPQEEKKDKKRKKGKKGGGRDSCKEEDPHKGGDPFGGEGGGEGGTAVKATAGADDNDSANEDNNDGGDDHHDDEEKFSARLEKTSLDELWSAEMVNKELHYLEKPAIKPGNTYIYPLWKSLLSRWLSNPDYEVYLATPFLDTEKMTDICKIVSQNKKSANIGAFYVRDKCNTFTGDDIQHIIAKAKTRITDELKEDCSTIIEEKISNKIVNPDRFFHAKFIACTHGEEAEVLVTSANFTVHHFNKENYESVLYYKMKKEEFQERFIDPLII